MAEWLVYDMETMKGKNMSYFGNDRIQRASELGFGELEINLLRRQLKDSIELVKELTLLVIESNQITKDLAEIVDKLDDRVKYLEEVNGWENR
jgi:isocitrate dehydrogenase